MGELRDEVCEGLEAADLARGRDRLRAVRNTFVSAFMAVVVLPELQDYLRSLNLDQEVVEMARELAQRAGAALSSISLGLIAIPNAALMDAVLNGLKGASPLLAPGTLIFAALLALIATYRHPALGQLNTPVSR